MTIKLSKEQRIKVLNAEDVFKIMLQVLTREKKIDRNKEHCWVVCLDTKNKILLIELISFGSVNRLIIEPMDVFSFYSARGLARANFENGEMLVADPGT
jgi:DNA repair protein RadC